MAGGLDDVVIVRSHAGEVLTPRHPSEMRDRFETEAVPHLPRLKAAAYRLTGNHADAEDLLQETYLRAYRGFGGFEPGTNLTAWLFRILRNTFINNHRKRQREPNVVPDSWQDREAGVEPSAETTVLASITDDRLLHALSSIPEVYRRVVLLYAEGFSYQEIAGIVGVARGTVMSRLHRGRKGLKLQLAA